MVPKWCYENERKFYEIEVTNGAWGIRTLQRQYNSSLYERLALSREKDKGVRLASESSLAGKIVGTIRSMGHGSCYALYFNRQ